MKRLIFLLFSLTPLLGFSQSNVNASSITLAGTNGTSIKDTATFLCSGHPCPLGTLILSKNGSDTTVFIKQLHGWEVLAGGASGVSKTKQPLSISGDSINIRKSNTSQSGYLSSTDWNTFNNKSRVAGSNSQIQFNSSGALGASANLTWITNTMTIGGSISTGSPTLNFNPSTGFGVITSSSGLNITPNGNVAIAPNGNVVIAPSSSSVGEPITLQAGSPTSGTANGGDININTGNNFGGGVDGSLNFNTGGGDLNAVILGDINIGDGIDNPNDFNLICNNNINLSGSSVTVNGAPVSTQFFYTGNATLDFPNTTTGVSDLTISVSGVVVNQPCSVGVPNGSVTTTGSFWCWVSSSDVVKVRFSPKVSTGEDPASGTFTVAVLKP